ncbi:uncharacterized protein UTRI_10677 [Ustilago trichophora]|uniref:Effector family protein Eff1 n=1 Tax=Ustilago trichophora TaxID=86804 RepID=A0A5C3E868_9BASI|nr:uncharacterized protein UTRI_10677 [Ustilago trichophora]
MSIAAFSRYIGLIAVVCVGATTAMDGWEAAEPPFSSEHEARFQHSSNRHPDSSTNFPPNDVKAMSSEPQGFSYFLNQHPDPPRRLPSSDGTDQATTSKNNGFSYFADENLGLFRRPPSSYNLHVAKASEPEGLGNSLSQQHDPFHGLPSSDDFHNAITSDPEGFRYFLNQQLPSSDDLDGAMTSNLQRKGDSYFPWPKGQPFWNPVSRGSTRFLTETVVTSDGRNWGQLPIGGIRFVAKPYPLELPHIDYWRSYLRPINFEEILTPETQLDEYYFPPSATAAPSHPTNHSTFPLQIGLLQRQLGQQLARHSLAAPSMYHLIVSDRPEDDSRHIMMTPMELSDRSSIPADRTNSVFVLMSETLPGHDMDAKPRLAILGGMYLPRRAPGVLQQDGLLQPAFMRFINHVH